LALDWRVIRKGDLRKKGITLFFLNFSLGSLNWRTGGLRLRRRIFPQFSKGKIFRIFS